MEATEYKPRWDYTDLRTPSEEFGIADWYFCDDLRKFFDQKTNYGVDRMLEVAGVYNDLVVDRDSETVTFWVFFKQEFHALRFIGRLNDFHQDYLSNRIREA